MGNILLCSKSPTGIVRSDVTGTRVCPHPFDVCRPRLSEQTDRQAEEQKDGQEGHAYKMVINLSLMNNSFVNYGGQVVRKQLLCWLRNWQMGLMDDW